MYIQTLSATKIQFFTESKKLFKFYFHKIGGIRIAIVSKLTLRSFALSLNKIGGASE